MQQFSGESSAVKDVYLCVYVTNCDECIGGFSECARND